jgi:hypothetical protein
MEESPSRCVQDSLYYQGSLDGFNKMLSSLMVDLVTQVNEVSMGKKATKYVLKKSIYFEDKLLHGLAQCIPDISNDNCMKCLKDAIDYLQNSCAKGKISGSVLYPSCIVRYDPYPFHAQPIGLNFQHFELYKILILFISSKLMLILINLCCRRKNENWTKPIFHSFSYYCSCLDFLSRGIPFRVLCAI